MIAYVAGGGGFFAAMRAPRTCEGVDGGDAVAACGATRGDRKIREGAIAQSAQEKIGGVFMVFFYLLPAGLQPWQDGFFFTPGFALVHNRDFSTRNDTYIIPLIL
jgi:hypothetical protein